MLGRKNKENLCTVIRAHFHTTKESRNDGYKKKEKEMGVLMEHDDRTRGQGRAITGLINKNGAQVTHFYSILDNPTKCSQAPYDEFV